MKIEFIEDIKDAWKYYSVWGIIVLGLLPDLFNLAVSYGLFDSTEAPVLLARIVNLVAFVTAAGRLIQQKHAETVSKDSSS